MDAVRVYSSEVEKLYLFCRKLINIYAKVSRKQSRICCVRMGRLPATLP